MLGRIDGLLEPLEDVLPADHDHRIDTRVEERRDRLAHDAVAVVLEAVDLDGVVAMSLKPRSRGIASAIWRDALWSDPARSRACVIGASIL